MPRSSRKSRDAGRVYVPGDRGYDDLMEADAIERWKAAGAPTPMAIWQENQRLRARGSGEVAPERPEWLTTAQVAERFRWARKTVTKDIREGRLIASQAAPGRPYRVRLSDAEAWATARRAPSAAKPKRTPASRTAKSSSSFRDLAKKAKP